MQDKSKGRERASGVGRDASSRAQTDVEEQVQAASNPDANDEGTSAGDGGAAEDASAEAIGASGEGTGEEGSGGTEAGPDGAEARYKELSDQYVRLVADFDNFRRRTRANEASVREQAAANLIKELLPVIDNLQLALAKIEATTDDGFVAGVTLIEQQLLTVLQNHGVQPIETAGTAFDPNFMEAVAQIDGQGQVEPGHVVEELRKGYMLHDKVLRAAQVVVAQGE